MSVPAYSVNEIDVSLTIVDGKMTVRSRSGAKGGSVSLEIEDDRAHLRLEGSGRDEGTATLTGPELSNFRTIIDAGLSSLSVDRSTLERDRRVLYSGFESLERLDESVGTTLNIAALQQLGLVDEAGDIAGGGRQVRCTVMADGTAILNLLTEVESEFVF